MYEAIIAKHLRPMTPQPTEREPQLATLEGVRAVLFDIYGTLLISGSGDIGTAAATDRTEALAAALADAGLDYRGDPAAALEDFRRVIEEHHAKGRAAGVEFPEVRIGEVWSDAAALWVKRGDLPTPPEGSCLSKLAIEYEMRVNPVWPMPGLVETLQQLRRRGKVLGVISNAQSFTPRLFAAAGGELESIASLEALGIDHDLQFFSFESRRAKPGTALYEEAAAALHARGLAPEQVLYVGNDLRNDVKPAAAVGFRTALFAGDARSLRLREEDGLDVTADLEITELPQLLDCV